MFYKTIILSKVEIYLLYSTLKNKTGEIQSTEKHKWSFVMKRKKKSVNKAKYNLLHGLKEIKNLL